jgi:hypothetical protein
MPSFTIVSPTLDGSAFLVSGAVVVTINDTSGGAESYSAKLFPFTPHVGTGPQIGAAVPLMSIGSGQFSASIPDGTITSPPPTANNREVFVEQLNEGGGLSWAFKLGVPGSGSSGSGVKKQFHAKNCRPGQLVPVALTLKLGSKVTKGTCAKCTELNRHTLLLHSDEAGAAGCWYSRPIAFCGKGASLGYWVLERSSATTWTLVLKQGDKVLVTFKTKTKPKDCSLPIQLQRKGAGNKVCKDWPKMVTISAAP